MPDDKIITVEKQNLELRTSKVLDSNEGLSLDEDQVAAPVCWYNGQGFPSGARICVPQQGQVLGQEWVCYRPSNWVRGGSCNLN